jgi:hypothetical protein
VSTIQEKIHAFISDLSVDVVEDRVVEYIVREIHNGRNLSEVIEDPYVRNRLNAEKRAEILENPEIIDAFEQEIRALMTPPGPAAPAE